MTHKRKKDINKNINLIEGYKWINNRYINIITEIGGLKELEIIQVDRQASDKQMINSGEDSWIPFMVAIVKYSLLANKPSIQAIRESHSYRHFKPNDSSVDTFLSQELYTQDAQFNPRYLGLNASIRGRLIVIRNRNFFPELHLDEWPDYARRGRLNPTDTIENRIKSQSIEDLSEDMLNLGRTVVYQPRDTSHLLDAISFQSPHKNMLGYIIESLI